MMEAMLMLTLVAGIDECGYGPILGPLIVSSSIFLINENPESNMWVRLQDSVGKSKKGLGNRILVCDSKKAFSQKSGLKHLEQTTKAFLNQLHLESTPFSSILPVVSNDLTRQIKKYPWYLSLYDDYLSEIDENINDTLTENMKQEEIKFIDFRCCCIDVMEFNEIVSSTKNKASIVISSMLKLIKQIIDIAVFFSAKKIIVFCDRLGGRKYYGDVLETLPNIGIDTVKEEDKTSRYLLSMDKRELDIRFEVMADDKHFPVALASMVGKYVREKILQGMCTYFAGLQPGLKSTAGYWVDGHRFLEDLKDETLKKVSLRKEDLMRIR